MPERTDINSQPEQSRQTSPRLSSLDRTVWSAWILQQIVTAGYPDEDCTQVAVRIALDYLARYGPKKPSTPLNNEQEIHDWQSACQSWTALINMVGGTRGLAVLSKSHTAAKVSDWIYQSRDDIQIVSETCSNLLALIACHTQSASLNRARYLYIKESNISASSVHRAWSRYKNVAHLIFATKKSFPGRGLGMLDASVTSPKRRNDYDDVVKILFFAGKVRCKFMTSNIPRRGEQKQLSSVAENMPDPKDYSWWGRSATLQKLLSDGVDLPLVKPLSVAKINFLAEYHSRN